METLKTKECFNCGSFTAYYSRAYCCFIRENCGYCKKHNKVTDKHFSCESWRTKHYEPAKKKSAVLAKMDSLLTDINAIRQFLEED